MITCMVLLSVLFIVACFNYARARQAKVFLRKYANPELKVIKNDRLD